MYAILLVLSKYTIGKMFSIFLPLGGIHSKVLLQLANFFVPNKSDFVMS